MRLLATLSLILLAIGIVAVSSVYAQGTITVDGDPSDWGVYDCTGKAPGLYLETINDIPQWIWCDPSRDERTDFASPDPRADLIQFRVTGDENYLYGLIVVNSMPFNIGDNGGTIVAITINRNGATTGGEWFAGDSNTRVNYTKALWQFQVVINLADSRYRGQGETRVTDGLHANWGGIFYIVDSSWSFKTDEYSQVGVDVTKSAIEFRIKWDTIGGPPSDGSFFFRISLITGRGWSNYAGNGGGFWDIGGEGVSDALDAITEVPGNTWFEVQDGVVDYYIDLYFTTTPPYYPIPEPILVPVLVAGTSGAILTYVIRRRKH